MLTLTYLFGHTPLVKTFSAEDVSAYPLVKKFTSYDVELIAADELDAMAESIRLYARKGAALLKGRLLKRLEREPRRGQHDKNAQTRWLLLDFDDLEFAAPDLRPPFGPRDLRRLAERIVLQCLPEPFHEVACIVQASASYAMREDARVNLHLYYLLDRDVDPSELKEWLHWLNFQNPILERQLRLSASGSALSYRLDPTVADNSRLIYIGHPHCTDGVTDPFADPDERIRVLEGKRRQLIVDDVRRALYGGRRPRTNALAKRKRELLNQLRDEAGLLAFQPRPREIRSPGGESVTVVTNPPALQMRCYRDDGEFVRYDVNGGDSHAYYVWKRDPTVVYNFKGEPNFLFREADEETWRWHLDHFSVEAGEAEPPPLVPFVFFDESRNQHYSCYQNLAEHTVERVYPISRPNIPDFLGYKPDAIDSLVQVFDPHAPGVLRLQDRWLNSFTPSAYMELDVGADADTIHPASAESRLGELCPTITDVIWSATGNNREAFTHFINWLAYIWQRREKAGTAWVLHGVQGTGKGVLFHEVLKPLFGEYARIISIEQLDDRFTDWLPRALLVVVDEFRLANSKAMRALANKLKMLVTERTITIRPLGKAAREEPSYANFLFFSNQRDAMQIEETDRRFNVAPRQEQRITERYAGIERRIEQELPEELWAFARLLKCIAVDEQMARHALENDDKKQMQVAAQTVHDDFVEALRIGDLTFFAQVFEMVATNGTVVHDAQVAMRQVLRDLTSGEAHPIPAPAMHALYSALVGPTANPAITGKLLARHGFKAATARFNGRPVRVYHITFHIPRMILESYRESYLTEIDKQKIANFSRPPEAAGAERLDGGQ